MSRAAAVRLLLAGALVAGCRPAAPPRPGRTEATATEERTIPLGGRTLVLDGFAGDVRVETDAAAVGARVHVVRRALGATEASARERLARVTVETGGDEAIYQVVWRADTPGGGLDGEADGLRADAVATVPPGTPVVVRTLAGGVALDGPLGDTDVGIGTGEIVVGRAQMRRLRLDARAGDVTVNAAALPPGAAWTLATLAGNADLAAPPGASLDLDARGRRIVDRGLGLTVAPGVRRVQARLGGGGARVAISAPAGTVTLGRATDIDGTESGQAEAP